MVGPTGWVVEMPTPSWLTALVMRSSGIGSGGRGLMPKSFQTQPVDQRSE
jgi:hypothetical protein